MVGAPRDMVCLGLTSKIGIRDWRTYSPRLMGGRTASANGEAAYIFSEFDETVQALGQADRQFA
jgi:hypothetical protein